MRITLLGLVLLVGCGGGDDGTSFQGLFSVDTWTQNRMTCDAEGPSVATTHEPMFYVKNENFLGSSFVNVNSCLDPADCKMLANDDDTIHIGSFAFEDGSDSSGWTTHSAFAFDVQGQCEGNVTDTKLTITKTTLRIEERTVKVVPFPASTGEDECPEAKVETAAMGQPCAGLEVVTATFMQDF